MSSDEDKLQLVSTLMQHKRTIRGIILNSSMGCSILRSMLGLPVTSIRLECLEGWSDQLDEVVELVEHFNCHGLKHVDVEYCTFQLPAFKKGIQNSAVSLFFKLHIINLFYSKHTIF